MQRRRGNEGTRENSRQASSANRVPVMFVISIAENVQRRFHDERAIRSGRMRQRSTEATRNDYRGKDNVGRAVPRGDPVIAGNVVIVRGPGLLPISNTMRTFRRQTLPPLDLT